MASFNSVFALLHGNTDVDILIADLEVLITTAKLKHFEIRISNQCTLTGRLVGYDQVTLACV